MCILHRFHPSSRASLSVSWSFRLRRPGGARLPTVPMVDDLQIPVFFHKSRDVLDRAPSGDMAIFFIAEYAV